ncbi:hypothetical protein WDZ92_00880 [Nostoc sp. NIES-2111]
MLDENYAFLLIDFQKGITSSIPTPKLQPVVINAKHRLKPFRETNKPVFFITCNLFLKNLAATRCDEPLFSPRADLVAAEAILQVRHSQRDITQMIFTGLTTSFAIVATVIAGLLCGYTLLFPLDALGNDKPVAKAKIKVKKLPNVGQSGQTNNLISLIR